MIFFHNILFDRLLFGHASITWLVSPYSPQEQLGSGLRCMLCRYLGERAELVLSLDINAISCRVLLLFLNHGCLIIVLVFSNIIICWIIIWNEYLINIILGNICYRCCYIRWCG